MTMHCMQLNNVVSNDTLKSKAEVVDRPVRAHYQLEPVIFKLATLYPMWRFTALSDKSMTTSSEIQSVQFEVSCDGEVLGKISRNYLSRDYHICVENDRIAKSMERSPYFYKTKDANKAIAKVKKYFSPQNHTERIEVALKAAGDMVRNADWSKTRVVEEYKSIVRREALTFIMDAGFDLFMDHIKTHSPATHATIIAKRDEATQATEELMTITKVQEVLSGKTPGVTIARVGPTYITRGKDGVPAIYTDQTLPDWMRGGLGMLKLIEVGQFVTQTGMRATQDTFVLIGEDLTTVSEGESK